MQCFPVKSLVHKVLGGGGVYAYIRYVKIGVAYKLRGQVLPPGFMASSLQDLQEIEVVYEGKTFACFSPTLVINLPWQA
jgi:hypothetical protein